MAKSDFTLSITTDVVDVRLLASKSEPNGKIVGAAFSAVVPILMVCAVFFLLGRHHGASVLVDMPEVSTTTSGFAFPFFLLALGAIAVSFFSFRYARAAWPSDEIFHCDHEAITISRIPWLDFSNRNWRTHTYKLTEVESIRYAVIASAKGRAVWGLRFKALGRREWALPGLEASDANTVCAGLRELGAHVADNSVIDTQIKQASEWKDGDTSWMDNG